MNRGSSIARGLQALRTALAGPRAPAIVAVALAFVLGWQLAGIAWRLVPEPDAARAPQLRLTEPDAIEAGGNARGAAHGLAALGLFGERPADTGVADGEVAAAPADAPATQLDLDLRGIYAIGEGRGFAIIAADRDGEQVFGTGDRLPGNARVAGIYADRVLLRRDGRLESLWLNDTAPSDGTTGDAGQRPDPTIDTQRVADSARELRARLLDSPADLARMVRFQPYQRDGELIGFRLRPRSGHAETLNGLGLTPDDVLTEINGIALNDTRNGQQALEELRDATEIHVEFLRDGERQRVTLWLGEPG